MQIQTSPPPLPVHHHHHQHEVNLPDHHNHIDQYPDGDSKTEEKCKSRLLLLLLFQSTSLYLNIRSRQPLPQPGWFSIITWRKKNFYFLALLGVFSIPAFQTRNHEKGPNMYFVYHPCLSYAQFFSATESRLSPPFANGGGTQKRWELWWGDTKEVGIMVGGHQTGGNFHFETVEVGTRDRQTGQW